MRKKKTYPKEYKKECVEYLRSCPEKSITEVAESLGVRRDLLSRWNIEYNKYDEKAFPGNGNPRDEEIFQLKKQIANLKEENEILKKATAIFSQGIRRSTHS